MTSEETHSEYPGHLVKKIRTAMGLKQYELVGDQITRNLISLIENNKIPMTSNAAAIIVENVNAILAERGEAVRLDESDLRIDGHFEAKLQMLVYGTQIESACNEGHMISNALITEINDFVNHWDIPQQKAHLLMMIGDYYTAQRNISLAFQSYLKSFESIIRADLPEKMLAITNKLIECAIKKEQYAEAVRYASYAENYGNYDKLNYHHILLEKAYALNKLGEHSACLEVIAKLESELDPEIQLSKEAVYHHLLLKGLSLKHTRDIKGAREVFDQLATSPVGVKQRLHALEELIDLLIDEKDESELKRYNQLMSDAIRDFSPGEAPYTSLSLEMAKVAHYFFEYETALKSCYDTILSLTLCYDDELFDKCLKLLENRVYEGLVDDGLTRQLTYSLLSNIQFNPSSRAFLRLIRLLNLRKQNDLIEKLISPFLIEK